MKSDRNDKLWGWNVLKKLSQINLNPLFRPKTALFRSRKAAKNDRIQWSYTKSEKKKKIIVRMFTTNSISISFFIKDIKKKVEKFYNFFLFLSPPPLFSLGVLFDQIEDNVRWSPRSNDHIAIWEPIWTLYGSLKLYIGPKSIQIWCYMVCFLNHIVSILYERGLRIDAGLSNIPCYYCQVSRPTAGSF